MSFLLDNFSVRKGKEKKLNVFGIFRMGQLDELILQFGYFWSNIQGFGADLILLLRFIRGLWLYGGSCARVILCPR